MYVFFAPDDPIILFFGLLTILLQRSPDLPCEDDLTDVDNGRTVLAFCSVVFALTVILPLPVTIDPLSDPTFTGFTL